MQANGSLYFYLKSPKKMRTSFRTSKFPNIYLRDEFKMKIVMLREYFKNLDGPPENNFKCEAKRSPVKAKKENLQFAFRSMSASKIAREDIGNRVDRVLKIARSFKRMSFKSCDRMVKETKKSDLSELIRVSSVTN